MMNKDKSMQKWILSFHWKTEILERTYSMYGFQSHAAEMSKGRIKRDQFDENAIFRMLNEFSVLSAESNSSVLQNAATKDLATESIESSLLNAMEYGRNQVITFVKERFIPDENGAPVMSFLGISKNKPLTMEHLKKKIPNKPIVKNVAKHGINVLQRLVMAFESGRSIDLENILSRELQRIPLSVSDVNGELRSGDDSNFILMLTKTVESPDVIDIGNEQSHLIIDAERVISSVTKRLGNATSFGDLFALFLEKITTLSKTYKRIDLIFNRFDSQFNRFAELFKTNESLYQRIGNSFGVTMKTKRTWHNFCRKRFRNISSRDQTSLCQLASKISWKYFLLTKILMQIN